MVLEEPMILFPTFTKVLNKFGIYDKKIEKNLNRSEFDYPGRLWFEK